MNAGVLVREFLLAQDSVTTLLGNNPNGSIYAGSDLPEGFKPELGAGILLSRSGGIPPAEIQQLHITRLHVCVWADVEQYEKASSVFDAVADVLHGAANLPLEEGYLLSAVQVQDAEEMTDPDTAWVCVYGFFTIMSRPN